MMAGCLADVSHPSAATLSDAGQSTADFAYDSHEEPQGGLDAILLVPGVQYRTNCLPGHAKPNTPVFPQLFHIGHFAPPTYGFLVALGVLSGLLVTVKLARSQGINPDWAWNLGVLVVLAAIVGAKVLLIINDLSWYTAHPAEIFSLSMLQAGGVFYGGLLAAIATAIYYMRKNHMPALRTCDTFAPGIAIGHAIGRIGCFSAGCCYGKPTDHWFGVTFTNPLANLVSGTPLNVPLYPTQLIESAVEFANFFILLWLVRHKKFEGQVIGSYLFLYGVARYFIEFLRGDPDRGSMFGGAITGTQFISILLVIAGGILWLRRPGQVPKMAKATQH